MLEELDKSTFQRLKLLRIGLDSLKVKQDRVLSFDHEQNTNLINYRRSAGVTSQDENLSDYRDDHEGVVIPSSKPVQMNETSSSSDSEEDNRQLEPNNRPARQNDQSRQP